MCVERTVDLLVHLNFQCFNVDKMSLTHYKRKKLGYVRYFMSLDVNSFCCEYVKSVCHHNNCKDEK